MIDRQPMQEDVFAKIGQGAVSNVLNGYNSTVFAYGQTGSGKTFTVTGGAERYGAKRRPCSSVIQRLFGTLATAPMFGVFSSKDSEIGLFYQYIVEGCRNAAMVLGVDRCQRLASVKRGNRRLRDFY